MLDLSIVVPVYKTEDLLCECLQSIVDSAKGISYEIIVVSDSSPGNISEILNKFSKKTKIVFVKHEENLGLFETRISGFKVAQGSYITTVDSDDVLIRCSFKSYIKLMKQNKIDILRFKRYIGETPDNLDKFFKKETDDKKSFLLENHNAIWKWFTSNVNWAMHGTLYSNFIIQKILENITDSKRYYINSNEDLVFNTIAFYCCSRYQYINDDGFYFYRQNPDSIVHKDWNSVDKVCKTISSLEDVKTIIGSIKNKLLFTLSEEELFDTCNSLNIPFLLSKCHDVFKKDHGLFIRFCRLYKEDLLINYLMYGSFDLIKLACKIHERPTKVQNICFVVDAIGIGGAQRSVVLLANSLSRRGFSIRFLVQNKNVSDYNLDNNIEIDCISDVNGRTCTAFKNYVSTSETDTFIFVDHWNPAVFPEIVLSKLYGKFTICMEHSSYFYPLAMNNYELYSKREVYYQLADAITCLNKLDESLWRIKHYVNAMYMPNPLTTAVDENIRKFEQRENAIAYIGRICKTKGMFKLIEIINLFGRRDNQACFYICGRFQSVEDEQEFFKKISPLMKKRIYYNGFVKDVSKVLRKVKVQVILSEIEGSPMVIGEARSVGTPTILANKTYIDNSQNGCLHINDDSAEAFVLSISKLLEDKEAWNALSFDCLKNLEFWNIDNVSRKWESFLYAISKKQDMIIDNNSSFVECKLLKSYFDLFDRFVLKKLLETNSTPVYKKRGRFFNIKYLLKKCKAKFKK